MEIPFQKLKVIKQSVICNNSKISIFIWYFCWFTLERNGLFCLGLGVEIKSVNYGREYVGSFSGGGRGSQSDSFVLFSHY